MVLSSHPAGYRCLYSSARLGRVGILSRQSPIGQQHQYGGTLEGYHGGKHDIGIPSTGERHRQTGRQQPSPPRPSSTLGPAVQDPRGDGWPHQGPRGGGGLKEKGKSVPGVQNQGEERSSKPYLSPFASPPDLGGAVELSGVPCRARAWGPGDPRWVLLKKEEQKEKKGRRTSPPTYFALFMWGEGLIEAVRLV
ncbi:hypothetical protein LIER_35673 [Lithospermum erythrorhizon]|uniref:Uncharacterized protein n=1 Tax=Lithospermum erythrorhizon TaxID=34254 RepID=A0AAV3NYK7_LITER